MTLNNICYRLTSLLLLLVIFFAVALHAEEHPSKPPIRIGLTPVFLDDRPAFNNEWRRYLELHMGQRVNFIQRGNYREIIKMLHDEKLDFAWLSGYPYVRNKNVMRLVAVPLYKGEPRYQAYLIVPSSDNQSRALDDLRGKSFAFCDPDSNSGYLYIVNLLSEQNENPSTFFGRPFFTWSHLKVIEAVASGLAQGGAVDGYVWETLVLSRPELTAQTRILSKSPQFGNAPFVAGRAVTEMQIAKLQQVLVQMVHDEEGQRLLKTLNLDGFVYGNERLYDAIEEMSRFVEKKQR
jgi:phosphonate transport system substrate-binding protein